MTSEKPSECYVYITLPGQTEPVTAGRFELRIDRRGVQEGRFVYGRSYLQRPNAVELDPVDLKLSDQTYSTNALKGVFGAIRDAGPGFWGRRVIQKHPGKSHPDEMEYLLCSPDDRAGALGFGLNQIPPAPTKQFNQILDLGELQATADAIIAQEGMPAGAIEEQVSKLLKIGSSMGGTRPKAVVECENALWIAKFNTETDPWNNARVEHSMLLLARACGITTAESRIVDVGGRDVLLVKRFDREQTEQGYLRARMISALTLLRAEDTYQARGKWSYVLLAEELRRVCIEPARNTEELFRRMCFNALISNTDDHPRNHALLAMNGDWKISPAYDLTPTTPVSIEQRDLALECGDYGCLANANNLLTQSNRFLIPQDQASSMIDTMEGLIRTLWHQTARSAGVTEKDCTQISSAFAYPGFRQNIDGQTKEVV